MDVSKISSKEDLADIIVILSMRPTEVRSLQINHYEPDPINIPVWYKEESDRLDAGDNYAIDDTELEESDSEPETSDSSKSQTQASSSSQTIEMNLMLAEIDAMLAEIQK
ncbi:highly derived d5-like helicase-primase: PROVISIONAL [Gigaspora margarita]|uniref:Highly derived d5-like helicase-primase: PROVISIONAL n=1 Tax=Gigaspora margarita TaxID=4874 RepID=A0A8H4AN37_GIGMA|nr:highly derived d5-like helicase-primase: PROVISIONAL [Gigaspora margarita]